MANTRGRYPAERTGMSSETRIGNDRRSHATPWLPLLVFIVVLIAVFTTLTVLTTVHTTTLKSQSELQDFDFTSGIGCIDRDLTDFWADALYTPDDFAAGSVGDPTDAANIEDSGHEMSRQSATYGTYRIVLDLPAGQTYAISSDSATYAQKVWINGKLVSEVGTVSDNADDFVPRTKHYVVAFTTDDSPTEIVIQRSNFVHWNGSIFELYLGPQEQVFHLAEANMLHAVLALGVLLTAFLLFLGIGLFYPDRRQYLWFAFGCLFLMIRESFVNPKPVMILFPELNWYLGHRLEHCSFLIAFLFLLLFYNAVFRGMANKHIQRVGYAIAVAGIALYAFFPSTIYSTMTQTVVYVMAAYLAVLGVSIVVGISKRNGEWRRTEYLLIAIGLLLLVATGITDALLYRRTIDYNLSQVGMMGFIFLNMIALTLQMRRAQEELEVANEREEQMVQTNLALSDLYRMRSDFMRDISHELRTPLTVMGSYAGLTRKQIQMDAVNERTCENLEAIEHEAVRLGRMVEQMKDMDSDKERHLTRIHGDIVPVLEQAAIFCEPVCARHDNHVKVEAPNSPLIADYVSDGVLQVLYNLIANANRHCHGSVIAVRAWRDTDDSVSVSVVDHGSGMTPELVEHAFESGMSGDAGSGLGLALCRQIIEDDGGTIRLESTIGVGTTVTFTLPTGGEEREGEEHGRR